MLLFHKKKTGGHSPYFTLRQQRPKTIKKLTVSALSWPKAIPSAPAGMAVSLAQA